MAEILFIDLWPDVLPSGVLRARYADLPGCILAHGHVLKPIHFSQIPASSTLNARALILSGSRTNLVDTLEDDAQDGRLLQDFDPVIRLLHELPPQLPILGICFGHQLLAKSGGGSLERMASEREDNDYPLHEVAPDPLLRGLGNPPRFVESHGWRVTRPASGYQVIARSADGIEMVRHQQLPRVGVQFHPEYFGRQAQPLQGAPDGRTFLDNWLRCL